MIASLLGGGGIGIYVVAALLVLRIGFALYRRNHQPPSVASGGSTITVGGAPSAPATPTGVGVVLLDVRRRQGCHVSGAVRTASKSNQRQPRSCASALRCN